GNDTSVLLWDLTGRTSEAVRVAAPPAEKERAELWTELNSTDGKKGFQAMARLLAAPAEAVALLRKRVSPDHSQLPDDKQIDRMIADLDSADFATRNKATQDLEKAGKAIRPTLIKALESKPGLEKRRRLEQIVQTVSVAGPSPELIRPLRAVELLERLDTPE